MSAAAPSSRMLWISSPQLLLYKISFPLLWISYFTSATTNAVAAVVAFAILLQLVVCPPCNQMVCRLALRGDTLRGSVARLNNSRVSSSWNSSSLLQSHSMWTRPLPKVSGADTNGPLPNEPQPILLLHLSSMFANLRHELETTLDAWMSHCSKHMCRANSWRK